MTNSSKEISFTIQVVPLLFILNLVQCFYPMSLVSSLIGFTAFLYLIMMMFMSWLMFTSIAPSISKVKRNVRSVVKASLVFATLSFSSLCQYSEGNTFSFLVFVSGAIFSTLFFIYTTDFKE